MKQGHALSPLLLIVSLEKAIMKVQETRLGLNLNGTLQVLAYADDANLIDDDIKTIERNALVLLNACKDIGLSVNSGKSKYVGIGRQRGIIANEHIWID